MLKSVLINLTFFKAAWLITIFAAAASMPIAGAAAVAAAVAVHVLRSDKRRAELVLLGAAGLVGLVWESLLVATGVLQYESGFLLEGLAPYWIVGMWILFATTLNVGLRWLQKSTLVAALVGAIGGPMAFLAGQKAGAVGFADPVVSLAVIGVGWMVLLPVMVRIAARVVGTAPAPAATLAGDL